MSSPTLKQLDSLLITLDTSSSPKHSGSQRPTVDPCTVRAFDYRNQLIVASQYVLSKIGTAPIALVLGSGLGGFSAKLEDKQELPYKEIPFLPLPTVKGHSGKIIMGYIKSSDGATRKRIMCFSGRLHSYEGYPMFQVVFCCRLAYLCGVHTLILTNAAGGCIKNQDAGSVVILDDYVRDVNFKVLNHSANDPMFGIRHPRGDNLLDKDITNILVKMAKKCDYPHYLGTYVWAAGPFYETAAHVQYCIKTGASSLGMSTVPSILAASNIGLRVAAMSLCTNVAAGLKDEALNHAIVVQGAIAVQKDFGNFVEAALLEIDDPPNYNSYQYELTSSLHDLKLNLNNLSMKINHDSFNEIIYKRKNLATYHDLYTDIAFVRSFLSNILDLKIETKTQKEKSSSSSASPVPSFKRRGSGHHHIYHSVDGSIASTAQKVQNRDGPIPIWILHDPFTFDITTLTCPISIPLRSLSGFDSISTSLSARNAIICFGFDQYYNIMVVLQGLELEGFSFDECNYIINLLYGVLGHKNLYFTNMFIAFPTKTLYSDSDDQKEKDTIHREQYALIKDSVDFVGGIPRFPFPLFPPKEINTNDCYVRMKYGVFGNTKTTDSAVECLKGFKGFFDDLNHTSKTSVYSYAYWAGPNLPTPSEISISLQASCELIGISNPFMTPMCRQLGHDGYSVAYIPSIQEFQQLTGDKPKELIRDVTALIYSISSSIITFFKSSASLFSPASMNRFRPSIFAASTITNNRLYSELSSVQLPDQCPQYQTIHSVDSEWQFISAGAKWLSNVWNFKDHPIINGLFSSFSHNNNNKHVAAPLVSINLSNIPGWKEHFCGGYPYTHYHWNNINPFEWTLKIFKYEPNQNDSSNNKNLNNFHYYIVIAPEFFTNSKLHPQRYAYMTSFYKYTPRFWNLSFIIRVLWKLGIQNLCFLSHLLSNNCGASGTIARNNVVVVNNYVECARWNILTGPNDNRMGPRFIPITEPIELENEFLNIAKSKEFMKKIESVITVHIPSSATISPTTSQYFGSFGYQTRSLGLIPCIQTAQHLGIQKVAVGITDYTIDEKLQNVKSFDEILRMIEAMFANIEREADKKQQQEDTF